MTHQVGFKLHTLITNCKASIHTILPLGDIVHSLYTVTCWNINLGNVAILLAKREKMICQKYYNILKQEIRFTLGLNATKNIDYIKKFYQ